MYPEDWEKIKLFREQYKDNKLLVISSDKTYLDINYKDLEQKYKDKIPLWETEKQNYKTRPDLYVVDYKTPEHIKFYQINYPNHINSSIVDSHLLFIANKCLSFNKVSLGKDPYIETIELIAITDKRQGAGRKSSGEYNYELWKVTTIDKEIFYVTNQNKTTLYYCYENVDINQLTSFFIDNTVPNLKYGRKNNKTQKYIENELWDNSDDHRKFILQLIDDKLTHKGEWDSIRVTNIILNKSEKTKNGALNNYEEWYVYCNNKDECNYRLTNFGNSTSEFKLENIV